MPALKSTGSSTAEPPDTSSAIKKTMFQAVTNLVWGFFRQDVAQNILTVWDHELSLSSSPKNQLIPLSCSACVLGVPVSMPAC